jgi:hypothetical protein
MKPRDIIEYQWPYLLSFLAVDEPLDESAKRYGALIRKRRVDSAEKLLRLALVYGFCGLSLRQAAAWAEASDVASLSDVALMKRLRKSSDWLGHLVATKLASRGGLSSKHPLRLQLVDASSVSAPGDSSVDWKVHLSFDLGSLAISQVKLTDFKGGESLKRFRFSPGDVVVADRGYSRRGELATVVRQGSDFIIRLNWANVPMMDENRKRFDLLNALRGIPEATVSDFNLRVRPDPKHDVPALPVRVVAVRKSEAAAAESRKKILKTAARRQRNVDPRALELAAYVLVITSLEADRLPSEDVLEIYRFRWQIELAFKRLKSLLDLDGLPAKDPSLASTFIYSKILAALLLDDLTHAFISFSPWGFVIQ